MQGGLRLALGCLAVLAFAAAAGADDGFRDLFNGRDLTGWRYGKDDLAGKTETSDKRFLVVDGAIVADVGKGIKDLYTVAEFPKNFILKMEFRAGEKADSGVYIRGPQLQIRDFIRRGEQKQLKNFKNDGWNELEITVKNNVVVVSVNGKPLTDKDSLEVTYKEGKPTAVLNGKPIEVANISVAKLNQATYTVNGEALTPPVMTVPAKGGIGLQAETGKFEYRRIRIKELE
jgi:hypothetical protein